MTIQAPLNPGHMIPNSMEVYIAKKPSDGWLQLGLYKDQSTAAAGESVDDVYSNGTIKKVKNGDKMTVGFSAHELTAEKLEILQLGLVELKAGTVVDEVETFKAGEWSFDSDVFLKYSNADKTPVTVSAVSILVGGTSTTLTVTTDYVVGADQFGTSFITFKSGGAITDEMLLTGVISVTYSATNANAQIMEHKANALAKPFVMCLVNEFEYNGVKKSIKTYLDNCQASKAVLQQIADNDDTTVGFPVEITGRVVKQEFIGFSNAAASANSAANANPGD